MLYGPNTNIVINGSIIYFSECEVHYMVECMRLLLETGKRSLECRADVHDDVQRDDRRGEPLDGVGRLDGEHLVQEREGPGHAELAVLAARVLGADAQARPRRLRRHVATKGGTVRFAIKTAPQHTTWDDMLAVWRAADDIDVFESGWTFDHFYPIFSDPTGPCLEGWTTLPRWRRPPTRLRIGVLVTGQRLPAPGGAGQHGRHGRHRLRRPARARHRRRLERGGVRRLRHRAAAAARALRPLRRGAARSSSACSRNETTDFDGRHYQLTGARCEPKPVQQPHPPIVHRRSGEEADATSRRPLGRPLEPARRRASMCSRRSATCSRSTAQIWDET